MTWASTEREREREGSLIMEGRLLALELSGRELAFACASLRRRVSRARTRAGQIAAAIKAVEREQQRERRRQEKSAAAAAAAVQGDGDNGVGGGAVVGVRPMVDPSQWREYFTEADLDTAIKVMEALRDCHELKENATSHEGFRRLLKAATTVVKGKSKEESRDSKRQRSRQRKVHDKQVVASTVMRQRKTRDTDRKMLGMMLPPDPLLCLDATADSAAPADGIDADRVDNGMQAVGVGPNDDSQSGANAGGAPDGTRPAHALSKALEPEEDVAHAERAVPRRLLRKRKCWLCKTPYDEVHFFYDQFCPDCASFNYRKRKTEVDLTGRVALVTGGRVKIGFFIALKLLHLGATVLVQTRFPHDAALRFSREADFSTWSSRLHIYGVDFRDVGAVHRFVQRVRARHSRLDILINNAAQTVRKPPAFYQHLLARETDALPLPLQGVLANDDERLGITTATVTATPAHLDHRPSTAPSSSTHSSAATAMPSSSCASASASTTATVFTASTVPASAVHATLSSAAALSQMAVLPDDGLQHNDTMPRGLLDEDEQQIDLRDTNSWQLSLGEISTAEFLECHLINATAPFILNSGLKPLMLQSPAADRYIVNVSAMEGQFYRKNKSAKHPHTNMAKAALNMMTRTCANEFAQVGIYVTSVDTGWITDENPTQMHSDRNHAQGPPPLDHLDAAMRVLDPVLMGVVDPEKRLYNVFLKDYKVTHW
eukprot:m.132010 g.132010  ORF g.132010 m.132010 type:complete len:717 (+) comp11322_c0_seq6:135-2285(+)